jgi:hypothetical protein
MRSERARIDRRLAVSPGAEVLATNREIVTFRDEWGTVAQTFDLAKLGLSHELMMLFADAFRMHYAGSAVPTRKGCWKALRAFAHFVVEDGGIAVPGISRPRPSGDTSCGSIGSVRARASRGRHRPGTGGSCM